MGPHQEVSAASLRARFDATKPRRGSEDAVGQALDRTARAAALTGRVFGLAVFGALTLFVVVALVASAVYVWRRLLG